MTLESGTILDPKIKVKENKTHIGRHPDNKNKPRTFQEDIVITALLKAGKEAGDNPALLNPRRIALQMLLNKGKPSVTKALNEYLLMHPEKLLGIARTLVTEAQKGNIEAIKEILNRLDGKVAEVHKIDSENPVTLVFAPAAQLLAQRIETQNINSAGADHERKATAPTGTIEPEETKVIEVAPARETYEQNFQGQEA